MNWQQAQGMQNSLAAEPVTPERLLQSRLDVLERHIASYPEYVEEAARIRAALAALKGE